MEPICYSKLSACSREAVLTSEVFLLTYPNYGSQRGQPDKAS